MTLIDIDDEIHKCIKDYTEKFSKDYPTMKNFVDKALRKELIQHGYEFKHQIKK